MRPHLPRLVLMAVHLIHSAQATGVRKNLRISSSVHCRSLLEPLLFRETAQSGDTKRVPPFLLIARVCKLGEYGRTPPTAAAEERNSPGH